MQHEWFGIDTKYYVRVYQENGKTRFEALKEPLFPSTGYEIRENALYNHAGKYTIIFYLDALWIEYDVLNSIAKKIFDNVCWQIDQK